VAELLYRMGRFAGRRPWLVIVVWLLLLGAAVAAFLVGRGPLVAGFDIPGTETATVTQALDDKLPGLGGGAGTVVFRATDGTALTAAQQTAISAVVDSARRLPYVAGVVDPFAAEQERRAQATKIAQGRVQLDAAQQQIPPGAQFDGMRQQLQEQARQLDLGAALLALSADVRTVSADGSTAMVPVAFTESRLTLPDSAKTAMYDHFRHAGIDGVTVDVSAEIAQTVPTIVGVGEVVGVAIAAIVLIVMLATPASAGLPILTALVGLGVGVLATLSLSNVVQIASVTPVLGVMLGLAVGIDYALFIINRHRRQLAGGMPLLESIGVATGTAGNAVVFAGSTVLVALVALNVTGIPFLGLMGSVGAACVAVAVLVAVTLTPALLALVGDRVVSRRLRRRVAASTGPTATVRPMSTLRAIGGVLAAAAVLLAIAIPALSMRLGLPDGSAEAQDSTQHRAYEQIAATFGEGVNGPLLVTASPSAAATPADDAGVLAYQVQIGQLLRGQSDVVAVAPVGVSADRTFFAFQVVPAHGPTSVSTDALVRSLRGLSPRPDGTVLGVAGQATGNIDISDKLAHALPVYLAVVVGLSALIILMVFRSLLLPVIASAGFLLSLFATYGALTAVYQWGWLSRVFGVHDPGPVLNFLPIVLVGILFGLAMDYQLFLASGMREAYVHGTPARAAVVAGLRAGRAVVTAAAIIMISVFGGFIFSATVVVRPLGFGLAFGVLADAFLVRMLVIPGLMHLFGRSAWWFPRWLDRRLPTIDIEGAALLRRHPAQRAEREPEPAPAQVG
jgi:RND superfamily putative drug exporter